MESMIARDVISIERKAIYSYIDYIKSEEEYLESEKYQKDKKYWEERFEVIPEVAKIPGSKENKEDVYNIEAKRRMYNVEKAFIEDRKEY
jgi:hypothetical protein